MKTILTCLAATWMLAGCISSSSAPPPERTTVVVPQKSTTVVCQDGTSPPCR